MSAFTHNFNHGFFHGMFNRMFGGFGMFNWFGWNSAPTFYTPNYFNCDSLFLYQTPIPRTPIVQSYDIPNFSISNSTNWQGFNYSTNCNIPDFSSAFSFGDTFVKSKKTDNEKKAERITVPRNDGDFDKMLKFVLDVEGGYTDDDCGQAGNKGVQQYTYDKYREKKGLASRPVKEITDSEVKDLYYTMFYKASGADKINDARMALYVFDTAVNMGVGAAKKLYKSSNGDLDTFKQQRLSEYERIANKNNGEKKKYLKGWKNRVAKAETYANTKFVA